MVATFRGRRGRAMWLSSARRSVPWAACYRELPRILLLKLFDNSKLFLVLGSNERAKAPEEVPFRCFDGHRLTIGRPSTIYQTVSPRTPVYKGKKKGRADRGSGPYPLAPVAYLAPTFQLRLAGVGSVMPAASVAFTSNVWVPLASLPYVLLVAVPFASQLPPSNLVWKVAFEGSVEEKVNVASLLLTVPEGPESMVVFGGVVSALPGAPWHASVPAGLVLLGGFSAP